MNVSLLDGSVLELRVQELEAANALLGRGRGPGPGRVAVGGGGRGPVGVGQGQTRAGAGCGAAMTKNHYTVLTVKAAVQM